MEARLGDVPDLGDVAQGHRRIVPLIGGTFTEPELNGEPLPGASADWQIGLPDGTALARGADVDPGEYAFRTSTQIETAAPELDWLNKSVFTSVGGRETGGVIHETYLVG